jgi:hypothetical protein
MEAELGRGQLPSSGKAAYKDQSVLILNQSSGPCALATCDSIFPPLQKSLHVKSIVEGSSRFRLPDTLSSTPDLIVLPSGIGRGGAGFD